MALTSSIKHAPRWAYYAAGGIGLGAVAIQVYKRRATADDTPAPADASSGATVIGSPVGGSAAPSPVITPPVIVQQPGDSPDYAGLFSTFGDALNTAIGTIGGLAAGDQDIARGSIGVIGQLASGDQDLARQAIASAGQAPAPAATLPTPIIVQLPPAAPATPAIIPAAPALPAACPASHPHRSARGCYRCEKKNGKYTHYYSTGQVVGGNDAC
jgi:hypothetical protein